MNRTFRILTIRFLLLLTVCISLQPLPAAAAEPAGASKKPNVLFVMMDDLDTAVWKSALQGGYLPNIQQHVIDKGTTFDEAIVSLSWCCPSRATFLSGQYPHNHGVLRGSGPMGGFKVFHDKTTIATWMHDAGYRTGLIGKYLNGYNYYDYIPPGWETWRALLAGANSTYCMYGYTLSMQGQQAKTFGTTEADYQTDVLAGMAEGFIRTADSRPFFLTVTPVAPHYEDCAGGGEDTGSRIRPAPRHLNTPPANMPSLTFPSFNEADMSDKPKWMRIALPQDSSTLSTGYDDKVAAIRAVDDMVGRLAQALIDIGQYDNTMFVVTSDNGYQYGTHRLSGKINLYEESIHLPLVIRAAGQKIGRHTSEWVMNNDWAPTVADAGGATPGLTVDGRSLMPLVNGIVGAKGRDTVLVELPPDFTPTRKDPPYFMLRTKDSSITGDSTMKSVLVYAETLDPVTAVLTDVEFYDLRSDPYQLSSLQDGTDKKRQRQMKAMGNILQSMATCIGVGCSTLEH